MANYFAEKHGMEGPITPAIGASAPTDDSDNYFANKQAAREGKLVPASGEMPWRDPQTPSEIAQAAQVRAWSVTTDPVERTKGVMEAVTTGLGTVKEGIDSYNKASDRLPVNIAKNVSADYRNYGNSLAQMDASSQSSSFSKQAQMMRDHAQRLRDNPSKIEALLGNTPEELENQARKLDDLSVQADLNSYKYGRHARQARGESADAIPADAGPIEKTIQGAATGLADLAPIVVAPEITIPAMGIASGAEYRSKLLDAGIPEEQANASALKIGALTSATLAVPGGRLLKETPGFMPHLVNFLVTAVPAAEANTVGRMLEDYSNNLSPDLTVDEAIAQMKDAAIQTIVGGVPLVGGTHLIQSRARRAQERAAAASGGEKAMDYGFKPVDIPPDPAPPSGLLNAPEPPAGNLGAPKPTGKFAVDEAGNAREMSQNDLNDAAAARAERESLGTDNITRVPTEEGAAPVTTPELPPNSAAARRAKIEAARQAMRDAVHEDAKPEDISVAKSEDGQGWTIYVGDEPHVTYTSETLARDEARAVRGELKDRPQNQVKVLGETVTKPQEPTPAQAEAGNYRKPTVNWKGLDIKVENTKGTTRSGVDEAGTPWSSELHSDYGYFKGTKSTDGEGVDVYMGPHRGVKTAYVVDQLKPNGIEHDEPKVVIGARNEDEAKTLYKKHYPKGWKGMGAVTPMPVEALKDWLKNGDTTKPVQWTPPKPKAPPSERSTRVASAKHDSILEYLSKTRLHGADTAGLNLSDMASEGLDPREMATAAGHGINRPFTKGGGSLDHAAEILTEAGYPVGGDKNKLLDLISAEIRQGKKTYAGERGAQTETDRLSTKHQEMSPADVLPDDVSHLSDEEVAALEKKMERTQNAIDAKKERSAIQAESGEKPLTLDEQISKLHGKFSTDAEEQEPMFARKQRITEEQHAKIFDTSRWMSRGLKIGKATKLYRGEGPNTGKRTANEGVGLYVTTDREQAKGYGDVKSMSHDDLPKNPLRFRDVATFDEWSRFVHRELGFNRQSDFANEHGAQADEWIRKFDPSVDGIQIGTGHGAFFVKWRDAGRDEPMFSRSNEMMRIGDLPRDMHEELFNNHAVFSNPKATEKSFYEKRVPIGSLNVDSVKVGKLRDSDIQSYIDADVHKLPPVVIADGKLIDGMHRVSAAKKTGIKTLRAIDVTGLINTKDSGFIAHIDGNPLFARNPKTNEKELVIQHSLSAENLLHAVKMGGLAVPSLAVTKKQHGITGFGEITLLGHSEMADPKGYAGTKVFGADVYSPRYPQVTHKVSQGSMDALNAKIGKFTEMFGDDKISRDDIEKDPAHNLKWKRAVVASFLESKGITPKVVYAKLSAAEKQSIARMKRGPMKKYLDHENPTSLPHNEEFSKLAVAETNRQYKESGLDDTLKDFLERLNDPDFPGTRDRNSRSYVETIEKYQSFKKTPPVSKSGTEDALREQVSKGELGSELDDYVSNLVSGLNADEKIFTGFTYAGKRRYIPHTLDNVMRILKKELRGGEGFNYGVGSLRSKFAPQFRSVKQIIEAKHKLLSNADFERVKEDVDRGFWAIANESAFRSGDQLIGIMEDAAKMPLDRALKESGVDPSSVSDDTKGMIREFMSKLRDMPTEYFEAKILREVDLAEFAAAVVPKGTTQRALDALKARGVEVFEYTKGDDADRRRVIEEAATKKNVLFKRDQSNSGSLNEKSVRDEVNNVLRGFAVRPKMMVAGTFYQLPKPLLEGLKRRGVTSQADAGGTQAIYWKGGIYFIADQFANLGDVRQAVLHESVIHFGLDTLLPKDVKNEIIDGIAKAMPMETMRHGVREYGKPQRDANGAHTGGYNHANERQRRLAAEEVLAYYGQKYLDKETIPARIKRLIEKWFAAIRDAVGRLFGAAQKFDTAFMKKVVQDLQAHLKSGEALSKYDYLSGNENSANESEPMASAKAPVYYSALTRAVETAKREKGTANEWLSTLRNMPGIKEDEIQWTGLADWINGLDHRATKQEVAEFLHANQIEVKDVVHGGKSENLAQQEHDRLTVELTALGYTPDSIGHDSVLNLHSNDGSEIWSRSDAGDWVEVEGAVEKLPDMVEALANDLHDLRDEMAENRDTTVRDDDETRYGQYALPGGKNYRELLLTLPAGQFDSAEVRNLQERVRVLGNKVPSLKYESPEWVENQEQASKLRKRLFELTGDPYGIPRKKSGAAGRADEYKSSHWNEPNILAHVRFDERIDSGGKRVLHIAEVQSDWGQSLRKSRDLREMSKPDAVRKLAENFFGREQLSSISLNQMDGGVIALAGNDKVRRAIVSLLPVDVMNDLGGSKASVEKALSKNPMVFPALSVDRRSAVAIGVLDAARDVFTDLRTKLLVGSATRRDVDLLPALKASDLSAREVVSLLAPQALYHMDLAGDSFGRDVTGSPAKESTAFGKYAKRDAKRLPTSDTEFLNTEIPTRLGTKLGTNESGSLGVKGSSARITEALDWHNKIREEAGKSKPVEYRASNIPPMPFGVTWPELAMKRMIRFAAENGFDRITWDTGATNAERYDLSKQLDSVQIRKADNAGPYSIIGRLNNRDVFVKHGVAPNELDELIGKDLADKARTQETASYVYTGVDLKVGGEGMTGFYDKILPATVNKLVKKWGGKVTASDIGVPMPTEQRSLAAFIDWMQERGDMRERGSIGSEFRDGPNSPNVREFMKVRDVSTPVHSLDITPQMRDAAMEGQPLFARREGSMDRDIPGAAPPKETEEEVTATTGDGGKGPYDRARRAVLAIPNSELVMSFRRLIDPVNVSAVSKETAVIGRKALGELTWGTQHAQEQLEQYSRLIEQLSPKDKLDMIDAIEGGKEQKFSALQPAANAMRQMLDGWRDKVRSLGEGHLDNYIENYFPHAWQDEKAASKIMAAFGRRPLRGPATFLKQRTVPTVREGIARGLKPLTLNPLASTLFKIREMQRFYTGVKLMQEFKERGLARFLPSGKTMPDGWVEINDAVGKVRQWSEAEKGFIERGRYIMPEDAGRLINNHLSASKLRNFAPAQWIRVGSNALNALQLGFSGFHIGFTTLDVLISKNALGIERWMHGEPLRAAAAFGETILGPVSAGMNLRRGHKLLQAYLNPAGATPELKAQVLGLIAAGGRPKMDAYFLPTQIENPFRGVGPGTLAKDVRDAILKPHGKVAAVSKAMTNFAPQYATKVWQSLRDMAELYPKWQLPFEVAGRITRASTSLIMEHIVPLQKLGVFSDLAADYLRRNPMATPEESARAMQKIWTSVDNRLGEMVYDRLFWNRTFKDAMHMTFRAVGWNYGTVNEIAGAPIDVLKLVDKKLKGDQIKADDFGHKIPYVIAMTMTTALIGATLTYLFTGEGPKKLKDYFFPCDGARTKYGTCERISLPSYAKDVYEYSQEPGQTVINKLNPIYSLIHQVWTNEDYFGQGIYDPASPKYSLERTKQIGKFMVEEATPFSFQKGNKMQGADDGTTIGALKTVLPKIGVNVAPGRVSSPDQIERARHVREEQGYINGLMFKMKKARADGDMERATELQQQIMQARKNMAEDRREVGRDKQNGHQSQKTGSLAPLYNIMDGKDKMGVIQSFKDAGHPALASLFESLPAKPRPLVAKTLKQEARAVA